MEEKFEKIAEAGYEGISGAIPAPEDMDEWDRLLDTYKLGFSTVGFPSSVAGMNEMIKAAQSFGRVQYLNSQVMNSFVTGDDAIRLLEGILEASAKAGIPNYIETHRGTITQDLLRTVEYVTSLPRLSLTIDLSHYVVAGELNGTSEEAEACFDKLLARTGAIHARVSDGEKVQIDIGQDGEHPMVPHFKRWWSIGMKEWQKHAKPCDVLPFLTELGPPGNYAMTRRDESGREVEVSDRWQQALLFKRLAEQLWSQTVADIDSGNVVL